MSDKRIVIFGSTGSIGINTLKVVERFPEKFKVLGLTAYNNIKLLERQIKRFSPSYAAVNAKGIGYLQGQSNLRKTRILDAQKDLEFLASLKDADIIVIAMGGSGALKPFLSALRAGKTVATANKEALVVAGGLLMREARKHKASIIPIDSEQSAIFQCLQGRGRDELDKVILTASGGALLNVPRSRFDRLSVRQILDHPRWKMGKKITVDSATMMNKGFEVIEAAALFGLKVEQVQVVVHPQAVIHSMAEFRDGSVIAQLSVTDMRLPIQYALSYPQRFETGLERLDFSKLGQLTFLTPDLKKFPALALAIEVGRLGGTFPSVLNAADEEAVGAFLSGKIKFSKIYWAVEKVVRRHKAIKDPGLKEIIAADVWARQEAKRIMG